jgi:[acyl-carrier-protein] S-malonyltransferase
MGKTAFIFPGQGSQYVGMGKELAERFPVAAATFAEANEALGIDLQSLCFNGPEAELKLTANTQPSILTVSIAAFRVFQAEVGWGADYLAGHSLGEFSALVAAEAMSYAGGSAGGRGGDGGCLGARA